ncbi:MAG: FAD-dependent oxidoreductase, partial [Planctomycetes bacterium]|nr:FAD-dependent oxidoreductase [Planctomycetota bacterium]
MQERYDVIVIGGGHAGTEAAWAAASALSTSGGGRVALITMDPAKIGAMSCNPAIGGLAKGQIVREIDALGGIMARVIDKTGIHFKMLNRSKGPAVWSPRAQAEKKAYQNTVKCTLEAVTNLSLRQDTCESIIMEDKRARGIITGRGQELYCDYLILTTGTFLKGLI